MTPRPMIDTAPGLMNDEDLALRLASPEGPALMAQMQARLAELDAQLRAQVQRGAPATAFAQLQASLQAVAAASDILKHMPVRSGSNPSPWASPSFFQRSQP